MTLYFLSNFNETNSSGKKSVYKNTITHRSANIDNQTMYFIRNNILNQQLLKLQSDFESKVFQIITAELIYRGIIIPEEKRSIEEKYLNSLILIENTTAFFDTKKLPEYKLNALDKENMNVIFCGVPSDLGAKNPGTRFGPNLIRNRSASITFRSNNEQPCLFDLSSNNDVLRSNFLYDFGNIYLNNLSINDSIEKVKKVSSMISKKGIPFFIGGDHLFTLPIVQGLYESRTKPFTLVQFDYHLDVQVWGKFKNNTPALLTTPTHANFISWIHHKMPDIKILQLGIDNYQSVEKENLKQVTNYLQNLGSRISNLEIMKSSIHNIITKLPQNEEIYISLDVDVLNTIYIEATGYPSSTGISFKELIMLINVLCKQNTIIGVDIMEFGKNNKQELHFDATTLVINIILEILQNLSEGKK